VWLFPLADIPRPLHSKQELLAALDGLSPTQFLHFPQNRFETLLSTFVEDAGLHVERQIELVELHRRVRDGPTDVTLRCLQTQRTEDASFDFVIGADGAHSLVRQLSAIDMVGSRNLQSIVNVHFTSHALSHAARENPAMLNFVVRTFSLSLSIELFC
jgi:2-polyprenyl-6-methoxyphenol hydroxylase-like FAD-dependent oxidoreductase